MVRDHPVEWRTPAPFWPHALEDADPQALFRPAILRFAGDDFMDDVMNVLATSPQELPRRAAQPETWQEERSGWLPSDDPRWQELPFKLYQPAHQRFYLVGADLVCRIPGLPCRTIDRGNEENVFFVLRRLVPDESTGGSTEEAWGGPEHGWRPVADANRLVDFDGFVEERHPLFAVSFEENGRKRRLLAGLIPVMSAESYTAAGSDSPIVPPGADDREPDPRRATFGRAVESQLEDLIKLRPSGEERRELSTFLLLDFAQLLHGDFRPVWDVLVQVHGENPRPEEPIDGLSPTNPHHRLASFLLTSYIAGTVASGTTWADALLHLWREREAVLAGKEEAPAYTIDPTRVSGAVSALTQRVEASLAALGPYDPGGSSGAGQAGSGVPSPPSVPKFDPESGAMYVVRCVYERPRCKMLRPPVVSAPSRPFHIASYFDPDAPTRPVRISLPVDTSIRGLRKFKRDVSFFASKQLRTQLERLREANFATLDDGPPGKGNFDLGMVCSLSIPIITICALVLLMVILQVLNFVFWWRPFCKVCFAIARIGRS